MLVSQFLNEEFGCGFTPAKPAIVNVTTSIIFLKLCFCFVQTSPEQEILE
jgi:hypothetical protein